MSADQMKPEADSSSDIEKCSPWLLFAMPVGLGFALSLVVTAVNILRSIDTQAFYLGLDGLRPWLALFGVLAVLATVAIAYFRPRVQTVLMLGFGSLVICCVGAKLVRVESFYGNMVPKLAWSWTPSAEERVQNYFVSRKAESRTAEVELPELYQPSTSDFPGFLGPNRDGVIAETSLAAWDTVQPQLLWRHPVGIGWSSFAVQGKLAINLEQRGAFECVVCYHLETGEELWVNQQPRRFEDEHGDGPRSTPAVADSRVYSMGANGLLTCCDLPNGRLLWKKECLTDPERDNLLWGMSGSPLVYEGQVFVTPGGENSSLIAFDSVSGEELWRSGSDRGAYASPMLSSVSGQQLLLSFNGAGLRTYRAKTGQEQWLTPWVTQGELQRVNVAQPVILPTENPSQSRVLISSGYGKGIVCLKVSLKGATSDAAAASSSFSPECWEVETEWKSIRLRSKMSNFVVREGAIYGLDSGIMTCLDLETGKRLWKRGRYGHGQLLLVGNKILVLAESGEVVLVRADPEKHEVLGKIQALDGKTWNHLALAGDVLVVRNYQEAAAYRLPLE
ncbi:MAG: PQQ-binding-like beta-propeller repeat protein [Planctomycetota bacterium]